MTKHDKFLVKKKKDQLYLRTSMYEKSTVNFVCFVAGGSFRSSLTWMTTHHTQTKKFSTEVFLFLLDTTTLHTTNDYEMK